MAAWLGWLRWGVLAAGLTAGPAGVGAAAPPREEALALVVGSNRGGPGQADLRYAEDDARRVSEVLAGLGRYAPGQVKTLLRPERAAFFAAVEELAARVRERRAQGQKIQLFFYYSGHARASALDLGAEEVPLAELRKRLLGIPSSMTIAVLDACQSGAFSRIKGAEASADFSVNSISRLNATGVAVMASSSATELSQESEQLAGSYFTHHLLVALRGAGDSDRDGQVTLSEAYRYAYHHTLTDTAATAVGSQHVTLETGLRGKGEVVLSYPAQASSQLELPAALSGQVLLSRDPSGSVIAELQKAAGDPVRLALPAGRYVALFRKGADVRRCELGLSEHESRALDVSDCPAAPAPVTIAKGGEMVALAPAEEVRERFSLELGLGGTDIPEDRYVQRLGDFGFDSQKVLKGSARLQGALWWRLGPYLGLVGEVTSFEHGSYARGTLDATGGHQTQKFEWWTMGLGGALRVSYPILRGWLVPYAQGGGGYGFGRSVYTDAGKPEESSDLHSGFYLSVAAGTALMPWRHFGAYGQLSYTVAPIVSNLLGDRHDSGGGALVIGLRSAF